MNICQFTQSLIVLCVVTVGACAQTKPSLSVFSPTSNTHSKNVSVYFEKTVVQLRTEAKRFNLNLGSCELSYLSETKDVKGNIHLKLQATLNEIPIWSNEIIAHLNNNGELYSVTGQIKQHKLDGKSPTISNETAIKIARAYLSNDSKTWHLGQTALVIYPNTSQKVFNLAYKVTLNSGLRRKFVFVSAIRSEILHSVSGTPQI